MKRTLGLDLGSNSLGWAILDDMTGDILDKGVVVFPEGIDAANDTLETPAAIRRAKRMGRRLKFRRKIRKWRLLSLLIERGMCPLSSEELDEWKKGGRYPLGNKAFLGWLKATDVSNPYCDRAAAAEGKVDPFVLGRALYHIAQRRGFRSSRKDAGAADGEDGEARSADKNLGVVKKDIAHLSEEIRASGAKTLGQYFHRRLEAEKGAVAKTRIRCCHTGRLEHYESEFAVIMDAQGLTGDNALRKALHDAIFDQRPLRSQKHLVGVCPLEPGNAKLKIKGKPRAQIGHPLFEEYRMLSFVNNLSFDDAKGERQPLTAEDRARVCQAFMKASPTIKFGDISKLFKKDPRFKTEGYKFHYYRDDESVAACQTLHKLKTAFGSVPFDVQLVFDALMFFDDDEKLLGWIRKHYPTLDEKAVAKVAAIRPKEGNAQYSLKAIRLILRFLRQGYELSQARFYAKLPEVIPDFDKNERQILDNLNAILFEYRRDRAEMADAQYRRENKVMPLLDRYRAYLLEHWAVDDVAWEKLYVRGDAAYQASQSGRLPKVELGMIRNPLVQRSMTTLRRLVNYLHDHGKIDDETTVRIELARNVNDYATRKAWQEWQKARQKVRENARMEIEKVGFAASEDALDRYLLWAEQGHVCLYTGRTIGLKELLGGNAFDIEHTLPRSLSGDDSLANKTICESAYNRQVKRGCVPHDCPNWDEIDVRLRGWREKLEGLEKTLRSQLKAAKNAVEPEARSRARVKALTTRFERDYWRDKLRRFDMTADKLAVKAGELGGFKRRQLVDTGIMCSHAVELLRSVYPATFAVNGAATAFARRAWGIQSDEKKDRTDHTHHAKDAMVIAALTPARFTAICTALKDDGTDRFRRPCDVCPPPYSGFAEKVRVACGEILVKHVLRQTTLRQSSKRNVLAHAHHLRGDPNGRLVSKVLSRGDTVRGALHKDTFYGCISDPASGTFKKVVRKPLVGSLKSAESILDKIVDPTIRRCVTEAVQALKAQGAKNIEPGMIRMPSGVPVNKVRVFAPNATNALTLRDHAIPSAKAYKTPYYVTAAEGSNFRLALFCVDGKMSVEPDNALVWAQNHKKPDYVLSDEKPGFLGYVMPGTMALVYRAGHPEELEALSQKELGQRLYKVVKFASNGEMTMRFHTEARAATVLEADLLANGFHKKGESKLDFETPFRLLRVSPASYLKQMLFEGIHFRMQLDGTISFMKE
ncbi:MAG: HNH endonuclease domain-containing protein [Kiritimatiellia bacterium]|nr:HNH endonuclease domain-containing protein [Kiritimatiellia bacterium]